MVAWLTSDVAVMLWAFFTGRMGVLPIAPKYKVVDGVVVIELLGGGPMVFQRLFALPCPGQCCGKLLPGGGRSARSPCVYNFHPTAIDGDIT